MTHHSHGLERRVVDYVQDAHAMERNSLLMLKSMLKHTDDAQMRSVIQHHVDETGRHEALLEERLHTLGAKPGKVKESNALIGSLLKGTIDQIRPDKAGKNARDAYVTESLEIAAYELLSRLAERAGDAETAEVARRNLADERAMAQKLESQWDRVIDLTLREEGVKA